MSVSSVISWLWYRCNFMMLLLSLSLFKGLTYFAAVALVQNPFSSCPHPTETLISAELSTSWVCQCALSASSSIYHHAPVNNYRWPCNKILYFSLLYKVLASSLHMEEGLLHLSSSAGVLLILRLLHPGGARPG